MNSTHFATSPWLTVAQRLAGLRQNETNPTVSFRSSRFLTFVRLRRLSGQSREHVRMSVLDRDDRFRALGVHRWHSSTPSVFGVQARGWN